MKIATFNVNSIRTRLGTVLDWLTQHQPDLLALQETKTMDETFPEEALRASGYHVAYRGQKSYNGVALLSRVPPIQVRYGFEDGGPADESRLQCAHFPGLTVINTYVPQGRDIEHPMYAYKIEWFHRLRAWMDRAFAPSDAVIWLGDLNVAHDPIDVHNPRERARHVCYHEDARRAFAHARDWGFVDTLRLHHPEPGLYTFFDYRTFTPERTDRGWRIDYILASPPLAARCRNAYIDLAPRLTDKPSDHTVLVAEFD